VLLFTPETVVAGNGDGLPAPRQVGRSAVLGFWHAFLFCSEDRLTFNGTIIETGTDFYRPASTRARAEEPA
jgi:hypothetical protein